MATRRRGALSRRGRLDGRVATPPASATVRRRFGRRRLVVRALPHTQVTRRPELRLHTTVLDASGDATAAQLPLMLRRLGRREASPHNGGLMAVVMPSSGGDIDPKLIMQWLAPVVLFYSPMLAS